MMALVLPPPAQAPWSAGSAGTPSSVPTSWTPSSPILMQGLLPPVLAVSAASPPPLSPPLDPSWLTVGEGASWPLAGKLAARGPLPEGQAQSWCLGRLIWGWGGQGQATARNSVSRAFGPHRLEGQGRDLKGCVSVHVSCAHGSVYMSTRRCVSGAFPGSVGRWQGPPTGVGRADGVAVDSRGRCSTIPDCGFFCKGCPW